MTEFDFLKQMYKRLAEFQGWESDAKNGNKPRVQPVSEMELRMIENGRIAMECTIKDYLKTLRTKECE